MAEDTSRVKKLLQQLEKKRIREQRRKDDLEVEQQRFLKSYPPEEVADVIVTFVQKRLDPIHEPWNPYTQQTEEDDFFLDDFKEEVITESSESSESLFDGLLAETEGNFYPLQEKLKYYMSLPLDQQKRKVEQKSETFDRWSIGYLVSQRKSKWSKPPSWKADILTDLSLFDTSGPKLRKARSTLLKKGVSFRVSQTKSSVPSARHEATTSSGLPGQNQQADVQPRVSFFDVFKEEVSPQIHLDEKVDLLSDLEEDKPISLLDTSGPALSEAMDTQPKKGVSFLDSLPASKPKNSVPSAEHKADSPSGLLAQNQGEYGISE